MGAVEIQEELAMKFAMMIVMCLLPGMMAMTEVKIEELAKGSQDKVGHRIIGGRPVERYSRTWQVLLETRVLFEKNQCGGSILSKNIILTAAHCLPKRKCSLFGCFEMKPEYTTAISGEHDLSRIEGTEQRHKGKSIHIHPKWDENKVVYDFAILKLAKNIRFDRDRQPIALPNFGDGWDFDRNTEFVVSGWGKYSGDILKEVTVPFKKCSWTIATESILCAGGEFGKDACAGDSGGPLTWFDDTENKVKLVGVVSFGNSCENAHLRPRPGAYSKVTQALSWIYRFVKP